MVTHPAALKELVLPVVSTQAMRIGGISSGSCLRGKPLTKFIFYLCGRI